MTTFQIQQEILSLKEKMTYAFLPIPIWRMK